VGFPRRPDRSATEAALTTAALRLLDRDGVLAGLNLREGAAEAGINRGLRHHYFGSRRDLLRADTRRFFERDVAEGHLDDVDLDAVQVAMVYLGYGFVLYREHFAAELGIGVTELHKRFAAITDQMLAGLEPR